LRRIAVITSSRADYGLFVPLMRRIGEDPQLALHLIVSGTHLDARFGATAQFIRGDGFAIDDEVPMDLSRDDGQSIAHAMADGLRGFASVLSKSKCDLLVILGDRYETLAAAAAAVPLLIPVVHIHGGEVTRGAIDDSIRHAITKLAHLHFVSTAAAARRVRQMGEEEWRVVQTGALGVDSIKSTRSENRSQLFPRLGLDPGRTTLLVTFHPVTLERSDGTRQISELLAALARTEAQILFTSPNADPGGHEIAAAIRAFCDGRSDRKLIASAGQSDYVSLLASVDAMVGNSSSGLLEAPSFALPVVNIGSRQAGRERAANVIDCDPDAKAIGDAVGRALSPTFKQSLIGLVNPYGDGHAAERMVKCLREVEIGDRLLRKHFFDIPE
jgi:UDP-hydrolysing UDP-N-acetyl-D-glucosamine 2-epimerase